MLVYRDQSASEDTAAAWSALVQAAGSLPVRPAHDLVVSLLIDAGEIESAVADALFPDSDGLDPRAASIAGVTLAAARLVLASWRHDPEAIAPAIHRLRAALADVDAAALPGTIHRRVSEGFAYYALHPETYAVAARRFVEDCRPAHVVCLGIRSIGTSLSAVVAAALQDAGVSTDRHSVRPHGHPFDRRISLRPDLVASLARAPAGSWFAVADEGPGLSGSSFASAARALAEVGAPAERIALFPGWNPDGDAFRSTEARGIWRRHRRYCATAREAHAGVDERNGLDAIDLSGGRWRALTYPVESDWPAVQPQHEVKKIWTPAHGLIARFAGLGRYGVAKRLRASAIAAGGFGPPPGDLEAGFLSLPFIEGAPCVPGEPVVDLIDAIAEHAAFVARRFPATRSPTVDELFEMSVTNTRQALGDAPAGLSRALQRVRPALEAAGGAAIDGRMLPHEWIDTGEAFFKVDALDHHADHFFPGTQDAGWDLAAAALEFRMNEAAAERLVSRYVAGSRDRDVVHRLAFHRVAYLAFRVGYATLAAESLGAGGDGDRFRQSGRRYRRQLRREVEAFADAATPSAP